jgi:hypothetical protein
MRTLQGCAAESPTWTGWVPCQAGLTVSVMSQGEYPQQRRVPRYPFVAPVAVLPETGAPVGGNVKELSLYGCYLDAASTMAPRTKVLVKIFMPGEYFEANATVAYANPTLGMGLVFRDVKPHFLSVLRKWLLMAMQLSQPTTLEGVTVDGPAEEDSGEVKKDEVDKL